MGIQLATESQWKACLAKNKVKDNGLQKALAEYERLGDDAPQDKVKALDGVRKFVATLSKDKAVAANPDVARFLDALQAGAENAKKEAAAAARDQQSQTSEIKGLCAEAGKLIEAAKDQLDDLAKGGGGSCENAGKKYRLACIEVQRALDDVLGGRGDRERALRVLDQAISALLNADEDLHGCLSDAHTDMNLDFKSPAPQLSRLKSRLAQVGK